MTAATALLLVGLITSVVALAAALMLVASRLTDGFDEITGDTAELHEAFLRYAAAWQDAQPVSTPAGRLLTERLRERYVLTLHSGETFDGLLVDVDERTVVMQDTSALGKDGAAIPIDGQVILERATIAYLQRP